MLALASVTAVSFVAVIAGGASGHLFFLVIPVGVIVFVLSLIIGRFIGEPLRVLSKRASDFHVGDESPFQPDGRLYEADKLAESFDALAKTAKTQQAELVLREKRQSSFISDVAHELRTPITAIHGNAELLEDPDMPPEMRERFLSSIISESERLGRLTKDLLVLQRLENESMPFELSRVNLRDIAEQVCRLLEPILRDRHANVAVNGDAPDVLGNADRLKQVLSNLVENASRFVDEGGHITINLCAMQGNSVVLVKDDGPGLGDTDPNLLFERFYRRDASRSRGTGGTGLGLAIVKSIVEAHDGKVEAFNLSEGGACFVIAIPSIPSAEAPAPTAG